MADTWSIFSSFERVFLLFRSCPSDSSVAGYSEVLGNVRSTLQCIENNLEQCSISVPPNHDPAIGTYETLFQDKIAESADTSTFAPLTTLSNVVLDDLTVNIPDLPVLEPDPSFDVPGAGADSFPTSTLTPTSAFFDYVRYAADGPIQVEEVCKQQEEVEDVGGHGRCVAQNQNPTTLAGTRTEVVHAGLEDGDNPRVRGK